jgi:glycosyltransferase involved in cell wall biosynthesis
MYRIRFRGVPVYTVPNGFDSSDFDRTEPPEGPPLRLLYSGRVYERQNPMRLLRAVRALIDDGSFREGTIRLEFVGRYLGPVRRAVSSLGLDSVVVVSEPLSHRAALAAQQTAHALVLLLGMDDDVGWRPAKLYEYLGARRPILVIGGTAEHEARMVVRECRAGVAVDTVEEIAAQLQAWALELQSNHVVRSRIDEICRVRYERRLQAGEFNEALKATVRRQGTSIR